MKSIALTLTIISLILASAIVGVPQLKTAVAQSNTVPVISILSPEDNSSFNVVLGVVSFQVIYKTNTALSWAGYSIDGDGNVTVSGNSTYVYDIENSGYHNFTLYANDTSGNWAIPQTVTYHVTALSDATSPPAQSPLSAEIIVIALVVIVVVVAVGLLVYFKKHQPKSSLAKKS